MSNFIHALASATFALHPGNNGLIGTDGAETVQNSEAVRALMVHR